MEEKPKGVKELLAKHMEKVVVLLFLLLGGLVFYFGSALAGNHSAEDRMNKWIKETIDESNAVHPSYHPPSFAGGQKQVLSDWDVNTSISPNTPEGYLFSYNTRAEVERKPRPKEAIPWYRIPHAEIKSVGVKTGEVNLTVVVKPADDDGKTITDDKNPFVLWEVKTVPEFSVELQRKEPQDKKLSPVDGSKVQNPKLNETITLKDATVLPEKNYVYKVVVTSDYKLSKEDVQKNARFDPRSSESRESEKVRTPDRFSFELTDLKKTSDSNPPLFVYQVTFKITQFDNTDRLLYNCESRHYVILTASGDGFSMTPKNQRIGWKYEKNEENPIPQLASNQGPVKAYSEDKKKSKFMNFLTDWSIDNLFVEEKAQVIPIGCDEKKHKVEGKAKEMTAMRLVIKQVIHGDPTKPDTDKETGRRMTLFPPKSNYIYVNNKWYDLGSGKLCEKCSKELAEAARNEGSK